MKTPDKKILKNLLVCFTLGLASPSLMANNDLASDIPDPAALQAYKRFWDAFQDYERQKKKTAVDEYQRAREGLESIYSNKERELREKRITTLENAINRYNENLEKTPNAANRPFVLLNLAQMYGELASLQVERGDESDKKSRSAAVAILKSIDENHKAFQHSGEALYLRANLLEANGDSEGASQVWKRLAENGSDRFTTYGNIAAGDGEFERANPEAAIKYYEKAKQLLAQSDDQNRGLDELRIYYRLAWAYFKAGKSAVAIKAARHILEPGVLSKSVRQKERISRDIAEVIGLSLYEIDNDQMTRDVITAKDVRSVAPSISLVLMEQYQTANAYEKMAKIGDLSTQTFPLSREYPDLLKSKAKAEESLGRRTARLETLEKLAMLLPTKSLWRQHNQADVDVVKYMEEQARNAAELVASSYYEDGLTSSNPRKFNMASTYLTILLNDQPNSEKSNSIRLKIANCYFFAGNLNQAETRYSELITQLKSADDVLMTAHYQLVLTLERIWRSSFEMTAQKSQDPKESQDVLSAITKLEKAVDEHANRFPAQSRSVDLLLVAASANRDLNRFTEASRYWQRVLLSTPSDGQRSMAIRGLVFTKLRSGKAADVIESVSQFLKLEDSKTLSQNLRNELLGVLSAAASEESQRLSKSGSTEDAANLLLKTVANFTALPGREQMWRDGAYFMAISGNWASAQKSAEDYLSANEKQFAGDMTYLVARANEYQMRFDQAVKHYLDLAAKFPKHERAAASIERAEKLASADENFAAAATATKLKSAQVKDPASKLNALDATITYLSMAGDNTQAMTVAQQRKNQAKSNREKIQSEITIASVRYKSGDQQTAVDDLDSIDKQLERMKYSLGDSYKRMSAEVGLLLGDHAINGFRDQPIGDSGGDVSTQVDRKSRLFSEIVSRLDKVASLDQPQFSPQARFKIAQIANEFADDLTAIPARAGEPVTLKSQTRFSQNIGRLRDLAQRYHGNNILAKRRAPQVYAKNEWVSRSALVLSNSSNDSVKEKPYASAVDQLSTSSSMEMPQQWSH